MLSVTFFRILFKSLNCDIIAFCRTASKKNFIRFNLQQTCNLLAEYIEINTTEDTAVAG